MVNNNIDKMLDQIQQGLKAVENKDTWLALEVRLELERIQEKVLKILEVQNKLAPIPSVIEVKMDKAS